MKFTKNKLLIGLLLGVIFFCSLHSCSLVEGYKNKEKKKKGGLLGGITNAVGNATNAVGKAAAKGVINVAKVAGKTNKLRKDAGKVYNNESTKKTAQVNPVKKQSNKK